MVQKSLFGARRINPSSELDEKSLMEIAKQTNGQYFRARSSEDMNEIYQLIDKLEPVEQDQQQMRPLTALFYYPLGLAALFSMLFIFYISMAGIGIQQRLSRKAD